MAAVRLIAAVAAATLGLAGVTDPAPEAKRKPQRAFVYVNAYCESCVHEAPYVRREIRRRKLRDVTVVGFRMTRPDTVTFARKLRFPRRWKVVGDLRGRRGKRHRVCEPTVIVIQRGSRVVQRIDVTYPGEPNWPPLPGC